MWGVRQESETWMHEEMQHKAQDLLDALNGHCRC